MDSPSSLDDRIARFWDGYLAVLDKNGITPSAARWYVVHVEEYLKAREGRKLLDHRADDVVSYLRAVGRDHRLESWQMAQVVHALHLFFCQLLGVPWCGEVDWSYWKTAIRELRPDHPTVARENRPIGNPPKRAVGTNQRGEVALKAIREKHSAVLDRLVTEIRRRVTPFAPSRCTSYGHADLSLFTATQRRRDWVRTRWSHFWSIWPCSAT